MRLLMLLTCALVAGVVFVSVTGSGSTTEAGSVSGHVYWTVTEEVNTGDEKIQRANLDGSSVQDLITTATGLKNPLDLTLDAAGGKIYWLQGSPGMIRRANLDGTGIEDLVTAAVDLPQGIAIDLSSGKIYWTDTGSDKIKRANLDGSMVEDLVTVGLANPSGIAVDSAGGKMYWTDRNIDSIHRANLDGSGVEDLLTGLDNNPHDIALDISGGKMYWTAPEQSSIRRANLDGTGVEDLVNLVPVGLFGAKPAHIALDLAGGKMYWTDPRLFAPPDKIQRANLDGTNVEDIAIGVGKPHGIALNLTPATPTPTTAPSQQVIWADNNCKDGVNPVDSLFVLRGDAGLPADTGVCPDMGASIEILNASPHIWGDVDCTGGMSPVDSLKILRFDAGLDATQAEGCPGMGTSVTIVEG